MGVSVSLGGRGKVVALPKARPMLTFALVVAAVSVAALAMLATRLGRLRGVLEEFLRRSGSLEQEVSELRRSNGDLRQEQQFLVRFVREFPLLTRELDGSGRERQIPSILLNVVTRTLEPRQAVVLVRRRRTEGDPERGNRLVVAAAAPEDAVKAEGFPSVIMTICFMSLRWRWRIRWATRSPSRVLV